MAGWEKRTPRKGEARTLAGRARSARPPRERDKAAAAGVA